MFKRIMAAIALVAILAPAALAHALSNEGTTWEDSSGRCIKTQSGISHGIFSSSSGILMKQQWTPYGYVDCKDFWKRPAGYIRVWNVLKKWNGSKWAVCATSGKLYNSTKTYVLGQGIDWKGKKCGNGAYLNLAHAQTFYSDSWRGTRGINSPGHVFS